MPNWTSNELHVCGKSADVDAFIRHMGENMDFERVLPSTDEDDVRDTWGTKWNAQPSGLDGKWIAIEIGEFCGIKQAIYRFNTAWDTPRPVIDALWKQWPALEMSGGYVHEGYEGCGSFGEFSNRDWENNISPLLLEICEVVSIS